MKDYENNKKCTESTCEYFDERMELNCAYSEDNSECIKTIEPLSSDAVLGEVVKALINTNELLDELYVSYGASGIIERIELNDEIINKYKDRL